MRYTIEQADLRDMIDREEIGACGLADLLSHLADHRQAKGYDMTQLRLVAASLGRGELEGSWNPPHP